jgi:hypothetical protein
LLFEPVQFERTLRRQPGAQASRHAIGKEREGLAGNCHGDFTARNSLIGPLAPGIADARLWFIVPTNNRTATAKGDKLFQAP